MKLSVIIPSYNEERTIFEIIQKVKNANIGNIKKEIIVIDDFSNDKTREILKKIKGIKKIFLDENYGKGYAVKKGFSECSGDILIIQDADLEYDPADYKKLIKPIIEDNAKVVYGTRFSDKKRKGLLMFYFGNKTVTKIANFLYGSKLTDMTTCYKVFHKDLKKILISAENNRFDWETQITAKLLKQGFKIMEIPISYYARGKEDGKKIKVRDGLFIVLTLIKEKFRS